MKNDPNAVCWNNWRAVKGRSTHPTAIWHQSIKATHKMKLFIPQSTAFGKAMLRLLISMTRRMFEALLLGYIPIGRHNTNITHVREGTWGDSHIRKYWLRYICTWANKKTAAVSNRMQYYRKKKIIIQCNCNTHWLHRVPRWRATTASSSIGQQPKRHFCWSYHGAYIPILTCHFVTIKQMLQ